MGEGASQLTLLLSPLARLGVVVISCRPAFDTAFEHKTLNDDLRAAFSDMQTIAPDHREQASGKSLPIAYRVQMEHQCMVSGADRVLFMASTWDRDADELIDSRDCWYVPDADLRARIVAGWAQFHADVEAYRANPPEAVAPAAVGQRPDSLPSLRIAATGMITESNLAAWRDVALGAIRSANRDLQTDEDFADAEQTVKWCADVEARVDQAKAAVLAQTTSIDDALRQLDDVREEARRVRLYLDKLVKARKESIKVEIVTAGRDAVTQHCAGINATLGVHAIAVPASIVTDLSAAIKSLRTLSSLRNAVDTAVANMKIAASQRADQVRAAVTAFDAEVGAFGSLFPDFVTLCATKAPEDLRNLMSARIGEHQRQQQAKLDAERERIRKEEQERADREAREAMEAEKRAETKPAEQAATTHPNGAPMYGEQVKENGDRVMLDSEGKRSIFCDVDEGDPIAASLSGLTRKPVARIKLMDINAALAPLSITAEGLASIGFQSVGNERSAKLYAASDLPRICRFLSDRLANVAMKEAA